MEHNVDKQMKKGFIAGLIVAIIGIAIWGLWVYADFKNSWNEVDCKSISDRQAAVSCERGVWDIFFSPKNDV
jgi:hypothetical protein